MTLTGVRGRIPRTYRLSYPFPTKGILILLTSTTHILFTDAADIIDALNRLWQNIINALGAKGAVLLLLFIVVASAIYKRYNDVRKDRDAQLALQEKEKSVQRLAEEVRMWRALFLKDKYGMTDEEITRLVTKNEFPDAATARRALEGAPKAKPSKKLASKDKGNRKGER